MLAQQRPRHASRCFTISSVHVLPRPQLYKLAATCKTTPRTYLSSMIGCACAGGGIPSSSWWRIVACHRKRKGTVTTSGDENGAMIVTTLVFDLITNLTLTATASTHTACGERHRVDGGSIRRASPGINVFHCRSSHLSVSVSVSVHPRPPTRRNTKQPQQLVSDERLA